MSMYFTLPGRRELHRQRRAGFSKDFTGYVWFLKLVVESSIRDALIFLKTPVWP